MVGIFDVMELTKNIDPGGYKIQCPINGCYWFYEVPKAVLSFDGHSNAELVGLSRDSLDNLLSRHIDVHATNCETVAS